MIGAGAPARVEQRNAETKPRERGEVDQASLEKLAPAVGADLVVGVGANLSEHRTIAKLERATTPRTTMQTIAHPATTELLLEVR